MGRSPRIAMQTRDACHEQHRVGDRLPTFCRRDASPRPSTPEHGPAPSPPTTLDCAAQSHMAGHQKDFVLTFPKPVLRPSEVGGPRRECRVLRSVVAPRPRPGPSAGGLGRCPGPPAGGLDLGTPDRIVGERYVPPERTPIARSLRCRARHAHRSAGGGRRDDDEWGEKNGRHCGSLGRSTSAVVCRDPMPGRRLRLMHPLQPGADVGPPVR